MAAARDEVVEYANALLEVDRYPEFAAQGLQVVGSEEVTTIACGVSCSKELFERAVDCGADLVLVHHGLFWRNEPLVVDARLRGRLEALFRGNASLVAYHLALDAHRTLGNNAQLAARVGADARRAVRQRWASAARWTPSASTSWRRASPRSSSGRRSSCAAATGEIRRLAVATGAAGHDLVQASHEGYDALLTGEPEEPSAVTARELGIHLIAAGHHATERFGVQALAAHLSERFGLDWRYLEVENPV